MKTKKSIDFIRSIAIILNVMAILFICLGIFTKIPSREIGWNYKEYVGGDAYNLIIEASIRGGEIAGAQITKTIYIVFGTALLIISTVLNIWHQNKIFKNKTNNMQSQSDELKQITVEESEIQNEKEKDLAKKNNKSK